MDLYLSLSLCVSLYFSVSLSLHLYLSRSSDADMVTESVVFCSTSSKNQGTVSSTTPSNIKNVAIGAQLRVS